MQHSVNCHFFLKYLCRNLLKILVVSEPISIGNFFIDEVSFELFKVTVSNHKCTFSDKIGGCIHVTSRAGLL